jgi:RND family efflux transporter MFP subunit
VRIFSLLLLIAVGCSARAHGEVGPELPRIQVRTVESLAQAGDQWVAGAVAAAEHAVISTRVSASVRSVAVQEGSRVRKGALLAQLADDDLRAQLTAARTAASAATAHARRIETLAREGQATRSELESAQAQRAQADAQVAAAREALSYAAIRAPFEGVVQSKRISTGDLVGPGQPLFELDGAELEIAGSLDEAEARSLRLDQQLHFTAGTRSGTATISALAPGGDLLSHRGTVRARVVTGGQGLRTGDFARLEIPRTTTAPARSANLWIPRSALVERGDLTGVFVAREGRAELRWLALGEPAGGAVPVRAGLRAGEEVIDTPGLLRDGQPVEVMRGH